MTPREVFLQDMETAKESAIRAELALHELFPSEVISKDILINMLLAVYFEG